MNLKYSFLILIFLSSPLHAFERKQEQFQTTTSYVIAPAPYDLPGIGEGWTFFTGINNFAFFYEEGASGDEEENLWENKHISRGFGLRIVAKSGFVFRGDWGYSDEGNEFTLIGSYP